MCERSCISHRRQSHELAAATHQAHISTTPAAVSHPLGKAWLPERAIESTKPSPNQLPQPAKPEVRTPPNRERCQSQYLRMTSGAARGTRRCGAARPRRGGSSGRCGRRWSRDDVRWWGAGPRWRAAAAAARRGEPSRSCGCGGGVAENMAAAGRRNRSRRRRRRGGGGGGKQEARRAAELRRCERVWTKTEVKSWQSWCGSFVGEEQNAGRLIVLYYIPNGRCRLHVSRKIHTHSWESGDLAFNLFSKYYNYSFLNLRWKVKRLEKEARDVISSSQQVWGTIKKILNFILHLKKILECVIFNTICLYFG